MNKRIYLDNASTTKASDTVINKVVETMSTYYGNPSSAHTMGSEAESQLKEGRDQIKNLVGNHWDKVIFTSGGTETNNWALLSAVEKNKHVGKTIITSKVEHPSVLYPLRALEKKGFNLIELPVDSNCIVDIKDYEQAIKNDVALISIMTVNNETGAIMPIDQLYSIKPESAIFHSDCIQALSKTHIPKVDLISVSGHKLHGPKGIGAICISKNTKIPPMVLGGGQEENLRSGTENLESITGFGQACKEAKEAYDNNILHLGKLKERLKTLLLDNLEDIYINSPDQSVNNILNISFLGTKSEVLLHTLEMEGIFVSAGSACSTKKKSHSHVLTAMGLKDEIIESAIRFSFSKYNKLEDMDYVAEKIVKAVKDMRSLMRFRRGR